MDDWRHNSGDEVSRMTPIPDEEGSFYHSEIAESVEAKISPKHYVLTCSRCGNKMDRFYLK